MDDNFIKDYYKYSNNDPEKAERIKNYLLLKKRNTVMKSHINSVYEYYRPQSDSDGRSTQRNPRSPQNQLEMEKQSEYIRHVPHASESRDEWEDDFNKHPHQSQYRKGREEMGRYRRNDPYRDRERDRDRERERDRGKDRHDKEKSKDKEKEKDKDKEKEKDRADSDRKARKHRRSTRDHSHSHSDSHSPEPKKQN
eukprot:TRINITY_DN1505_c1_g2_i1.p1 TRINITY_DN1505_c1_g2~~TRINITY_DN1505_c1_g2_i1.p1  ORF type:complete len:196 (-),score=41.55 TRINITY_DN1505_c1_g2_i1:49-636(-)